ncbi:PAP/25A-associated domain-containing protein, partial [Reticulomyxa filosa]
FFFPICSQSLGKLLLPLLLFVVIVFGQYAWKVGHALENNSEGIECLTNYLQCEVTLTFNAKAGVYLFVRGEHDFFCVFWPPFFFFYYVYVFTATRNTQVVIGGCTTKKETRKRPKTREKTVQLPRNTLLIYTRFACFFPRTTTAFDLNEREILSVIPLLWNKQFFKKKNKHGMGMANPLLNLPFTKRSATKMKEVVDTKLKVKVKVEKKSKRKVDKKSKNEKNEMELSEVDIIKQEDDGTESPPDDGFIDGIGDSMDDNNIGDDGNGDGDGEDKNKVNTNDNANASISASANANANDDDDFDNSSSDEPLISVKARRAKKEKTEKSSEDCWQKLRQDNKELKDNMDQMDTKIRQLTNFQDSEMSSLRKQLHVSNRRGGDAESRNAEYEERIKSIVSHSLASFFYFLYLYIYAYMYKEEIASSKQAQQSLLNELNALRVRFEMLQNQSSTPVHGMMSPNTNLFGFASDIPQQLFHRSFSNPAMPSQPIPQTLPPSFPALHQIPAVSTFPAPSAFPNMFGFFGPNNFTPNSVNNGHSNSNSSHVNNSNSHIHNNNNIINNNSIGNLSLPPLITDSRNSLPLVSSDFGRLVDANAFFNSGNGFPKMDSVNNYELRSVASDTTFTWSHNDAFAPFPHSPGESIETMDVDL